MDSSSSDEGTMVVRRPRSEIDTSAPFRSVKEAVMLFGERVLVGEVYANKLKELQGAAATFQSDSINHGPSKLGTVTAELEETKQSLQKAREEGMLMANSLNSLQEELEKTKKELQKLKVRENDFIEKQWIESEDIKDIRFIDIKPTTNVEIRKFASPPSLTRVISSPGESGDVLERSPSLQKKKKKPLIPLIGGIF
ncbi:hypothetical protein MKW92_049965 [Papaver armeniacum]|nr:hypothetical protein MKW92_049965 [Papaver armeniacum]